MSLIKLKKVYKKYKNSKKYALKDISLSINRGESLGIIGENGSGKSTLLKLIANHIYPTKGSIHVNGEVETLFDNQILTDPYLSPDFISKQYLYLKGFRGDVEAKVSEIKKFCSIQDRFFDPFYTLSLGMKARVQFAIKTSFYKQIVLVDEVLGAGDITTIKPCADRIKNISSNSTFICVSHSLGQIKEFCQRCIWIKDGEIYNDSDTEEVIKNYEKYMLNKIRKINYSRFKNKNYQSILNSNPENSRDFDQTIKAWNWIVSNKRNLCIKRSLDSYKTTAEIFTSSPKCFNDIQDQLKVPIKSFLALSKTKNVLLISKSNEKIDQKMNSLSIDKWIIFINIYSKDRENNDLYLINIEIAQNNNSDPPILLLPSEIKNENSKKINSWQNSDC